MNRFLNIYIDLIWMSSEHWWSAISSRQVHHQSLDESPDFLWGDICSKSTTDKPATPIVDFDEQVLPRVKCAADCRMSRISRIIQIFCHGDIPPWCSIFNATYLMLLFLTFMLVAFWWLWTWRYKTCSEHAHDETVFPG